MNLFEISLTFAIAVLGICLIMILIRFIKGPHLPDRVSAFDLFSASVIGIITITAVLSGSSAYFDVAIVLSLISFLGAMSFAYFLNKRIKTKPEKKHSDRIDP